MSKVSTPIRIALVNVRSLANKSFILNDFFTSYALDILYVTETCISGSDLSAFQRFYLLTVKNFNSPRSSGQGGGETTIFKEKCNCCQLSSDNYFSFELKIYEMARF